MKLLIYLAFLFFSLGQLGRVSFFNQEINVYLYEVPLAITLGILFFRHRLKPIIYGYKRFKILFVLLLVFTVSYLLSVFNYSPFQNLVAALYFVRLLMYLGYCGYLGYLIKKEHNFQRTIIHGISLFIGLTILSSVIQFTLYPNLRNLIYLGWDPHLGRLFGLFFDTSIAAAIFGALFFFLLSAGERIVSNKKILYGLLFIFCLFLILTFSRSAYAAFIATSILYVLQRKKVVLFAFIIVLFFLLLLTVPKKFGFGVGLGRTFSISSRLGDYKEAVNLWSKHKLFGIGYNRIRSARENIPIDSHAGASFSSSYLIILVSGGTMGLILFLLTFSKLLSINQHTQLILTFIGILSFTDNIALHPFLLFLLGSMTILLINPLSGKSQR